MEPKQNSPIYNQESYFTMDSVEDIDSEYEVSLNQNHSLNVSKTSSVRCSGDIANSVSSINTSILDDTEEVKILKEKISEMETKCKYLGNENEKLTVELTTQKNRNQKLERKLQFVKDNQEVFMRLKEAYINMKYNEAAGRKMIEIREKGIQTWDGILCKGCIQAEEIRRNVESIREMYSDSYIVASFEMDQLVNTVKYLKDLIDRREAAWSSYLERERLLQNRMNGVEEENSMLRNILKNRKINIEDIQVEEPQHETMSNKDIIQLRKIIVKFEKKFREMEKNNPGQLKLTSPLNDKERKIVHVIMARYNARLQKKSTDKIRSQSTSRDTARDNMKLINNLKLGISCHKLKPKSPLSGKMGFECGTREGTAIMMMDELFSSESKLI